jgi:hypothetical protein
VGPSECAKCKSSFTERGEFRDMSRRTLFCGGCYFLLIILSRMGFMTRSRASSVGIATGFGLDYREVGVRIPAGSRISTSPCRPDRLWGLPNLLYNGYRGAILGG